MMKRLGKFPLAGLVSLMVILTLGPLALLAHAGVTVAGNALTNEVKARVSSTAGVSASLVSDKLESLAELVDSYADRPSLIEAIHEGGAGSRATIRSHLKNLREREGIGTAFLADPRGILIDILPQTPSIIGENFSYRDWYRGVTRTGEPYVSEVYRTAAKGNPLVIAVAAPVRVQGPLGEQEKVVGILVAAYDLDALQRFTDEIAREQATSLTVTDQRGVVVATSGGDSSTIVSLRDEWDISEALAGRSGTLELGVGDDGILSAYTPVPEIGFVVTASVPSKVAFAGVRTLRSTVLGIASVLALVLTAGLFLLVLALRGERLIQKTLEGSEARTRAVIEAARDAFISMDSDGVIVGWNGQAELMFGWPASEAIGRNLTDEIVSPAFKEAIEQGLLEFLSPSDGPSQRIEFVASRRNGEAFPAELSSWPTDIGGSLTFHAFVRDVTDRNRVRDEMQAARLEAEDANLSKSEFLSRMSHELRTPMNGILGFAQLLEMEGGLRPDQEESVHEIKRAGAHLLDLINEVLDIARIESGKLPVSLEPVSLDEIVCECTSLVGPLVDQRGITLTVETGTKSLFVLADHQRLKQLLLNLLSNATKYNSRHGRITVNYRELPDACVELSVSDTGPGIAPEMVERLFTPFDRLDVPDEQEEGTGLGLALCQKLAEVMNGSLSVVSEKGTGSTFSIVLPVAEPPQLDDVSEIAAAPDGAEPEMSRRSTILYVEDNVANVTLVEKILKRRPGITLHTVMQGRLGIDLARELRPDLVLLDMHLPDMNGDEVLFRLQQDAVTAAIPVVMLSADATDGQISRMLAAGAAGYVTKPLDIAQFLNTVDTVLTKGSEFAATP